MALIEWQEKFRIGIPSVDYEHQEMIALLNELYTGLAAGAGSEEIMGFLGEVYARISAHFALEEKVMKESRYDRLSEHKADHEDLLDQIRDIMDDYELGEGGQSVEGLGKRMEAWFANHFATHDARLHKAMGDLGLDFGEV
jgi:hemerythrin-like metal-binding protein